MYLSSQPNTSKVFLNLLVVVMLGLSACNSSITQPNSSINENSESPTPETIISVSGLLVETPLAQLVQQSDLIIVGEVLPPLASRTTMTDGRLPETVSGSEVPDDTFIYTDHPIQVEQVLKGTSEQANVIVRLLGGTVGDISMEVDYEPILMEGQKVLLFLTREDTLTGDTNSTHYKVIAAPNAAYQIQGDTATTIAGSQSIELETLLGKIRQFSSR